MCFLSTVCHEAICFERQQLVTEHVQTSLLTYLLCFAEACGYDTINAAKFISLDEAFAVILIYILVRDITK